MGGSACGWRRGGEVVEEEEVEEAEAQVREEAEVEVEVVVRKAEAARESAMGQRYKKKHHKQNFKSS